MIEDAIHAEIEEGYSQLDEDELKDLAESNKCRLILTNKRTVLLDLDSQAAMDQYTSLHDLLAKIFVIKDVKIWQSKSGNNHVMITVGEDLTVTERMLIAACLGSDPKRELLHLHGARQHGKPNICLFQPK